MSRPIFLPRQPFRIAALLFLLSAPVIPAGAANIVDAARNGKLDTVKSLLDSGVSPNARKHGLWIPPFFYIRRGDTALCAAARAGNTEIVRMLLAAGADRTMRCRGFFWWLGVGGEGPGYTPLWVAAWMGHADTVKTLLHEPRLDQLRDLGKTVSVCPFCIKFPALNCPENCILENDVFIDIAFPLPEPVMKAADVRKIARHYPNVTAAIEEALNPAAPESSPSSERNTDQGLTADQAQPPAPAAPEPQPAPTDEKPSLTPLMAAARDGNLQGVKRLIAGGTPLDAADSRQRTALMWASRNGHAGIAQALMAAGASVNLKDIGGMTALMLAAQGLHADCIKSLILGGADLKAKDNEGRTALDMALAQGGISSAAVQALQNSGNQ